MEKEACFLISLEDEIKGGCVRTKAYFSTKHFIWTPTTDKIKTYSSTNTHKIFVIGGTGAQGIPVKGKIIYLSLLKRLFRLTDALNSFDAGQEVPSAHFDLGYEKWAYTGAGKASRYRASRGSMCNGGPS